MKKAHYLVLLFFSLLLLFYPNVSYAEESIEEQTIQAQKESLGIGEFLKKAEEYTKEVFGDTDYNTLFEEAISGNIDNKKLGNSILNLLGKETLGSVRTIGIIIVIIVIHSIVKSISDHLENKSIAQLTYYVQYILIVTLIMSSFADILSMVKDTIQNLVDFSNLLIPILMTLILTTGNIASVGMLQPILLFMITFIGNLVNQILIPILLVSTVLAIISKVSDRIALDRFSKFFKSSIVWALGVILTLFVSLVSLEGTLSSSVDGVTAKTTKAAVSSFIPVVGKILGDAVDTVIGCTSILKNAVGVVGVITILGICILPVIKLVLLMATYYIGAAICEPIADEKIVKLLEQVGDTFKILLAILCSISVLLIIGTTLVMKISNSGLMYR